MPNLYTYKNQDYHHLKSLHSSHNLFEDPEFPATDRSIYYTKRVPSSVSWRRPFEICSNPSFIVNEATRFDLDQGSIGNCWFIAAVSMVTQNPDLFDKVVPRDQSFQKDRYAGIFYFRFWQFGKWYDVVVDDRLPVSSDGKLLFCHNKEETNEFWAALLEKAYAKLSWSYEGLEAGQTTDALIDMTGGIEETFHVKDIQAKDSFWETMKNALMHDAMIGCSLTADQRISEAKLANGLVRGHAYAVTGAVTINVRGQIIRLIRNRNPWGNEVEWNGAWSDSDERWQSIDQATRTQMGVKSQIDGEFWMSYEDWLREFDLVQICNLSPDTFDESSSMTRQRSSWRLVMFDGLWSRGCNAGGCGQGSNVTKFWTNPQYLVQIKSTLQLNNNDGNRCMMIVACLQKHTRQKRMQIGGRSAEEYVQLRVYKVNENACRSLQDGDINVHFFPKDVIRLCTSGPYINKREVTCRLNVEPGFYLIIPSTYEANREGKFLIRVFAEAEMASRYLQGKPTEQSISSSPNQFFRKISVEVFGDKPNQEIIIDNSDKEIIQDELCQEIQKGEPSGTYNYIDGMGLDPKYEIKQWWDSLPADERDRVIKMAVPVVGLCCCLMLFHDLTRKFQDLSSNYEHE